MALLNRRRLLLAWALGCGVATQVCAEPLAPQTAAYRLGRGALTLGTGSQVLKPAGAPDCYRYESSASPVGVAIFFVGDVREISEFCLVDGQVRAQSYEYRRSDRSRDDYSLLFAWSRRVVRRQDGVERPLEDGMMDRLAMQVQIQRWARALRGEPSAVTLTVPVVERSRSMHYVFQIMRREPIEVPAGRYQAVLVERIDDRKRYTRFWLAPELDYVAVRVEQTKDGAEEFHLELDRP